VKRRFIAEMDHGEKKRAVPQHQLYDPSPSIPTGHINIYPTKLQIQERPSDVVKNLLSAYTNERSSDITVL